MEAREANTHNLKAVDVDIPLCVVVVVTGRGGSEFGERAGRGRDSGPQRHQGLAAEQPGDVGRPCGCRRAARREWLPRTLPLATRYPVPADTAHAWRSRCNRAVHAGESVLPA